MKKFLLFLCLFLSMTNVKALTFDIDVTNIEDEGSNSSGTIENIDIPNKELDVLFQNDNDEVNFAITTTNIGNKAGVLKEINFVTENNMIEYSSSLPENGLSINANGTLRISIKAKLKGGSIDGLSTSKIKLKYKYDEGSCPKGEILSEDETECLCPNDYIRNEIGECIKPPENVDCTEGKVYNEIKKICEEVIITTSDVPLDNPKTKDNIIIVLGIFLISGIGIFVLLFAMLKTKKARIIASAVTLTTIIVGSLTVLISMFGIEDLLGAVINPVEKEKELIIKINEKIELTEPCNELNCTEIEVDEIDLSESLVRIGIGGTDMLIASISPSNASDRTLTWTSSDPSVVTVDNNGKITALSEGTVTITATSNNNKTATCIVKSILQETVYVYFYNTRIKSDAIFIKSGNKTMIIDGGVRSKTFTVDGEGVYVTNDFAEYIESLDVTKVDAYVGTHGHPDHVAIAGKLIDTFDIENIYVASGDIPNLTPVKMMDTNEIIYKDTSGDAYIYSGIEYRNYVVDLMFERSKSVSEREAIANAQIHYLDASSASFNLGNLTFTVLNPLYSNWPTNIDDTTDTDLMRYDNIDAYNADTSGNNYTYSPLNANSLLLRMDRGDTSFLFGADVVDDKRIRSIHNVFPEEMKVDVYKNGHHHFRIKTVSNENIKQRISFINPKYIILTPDEISQFNAFNNTGIDNIDVYSVNCGNDVVIKSDGIDIEVVRGTKYSKSCNLNY